MALTRARNLSGKVALAVGSLLFFAALGEGALRVASALLQPRFTKVDPEVGWYHHASVGHEEEFEGHGYWLSYNGHGYRPPEHSYEKPPGTLRVVVLGDSFTDASEVGDSETYTWLLQERLDGVEVVNLGVYGYSTVQQLITLEREGVKYDPDLVLLVSTPNDLTENHLNTSDFGPRPRFLVSRDSMWFEGTDHPSAQEVFRETNLPFPGRKFLHRHSYLYYFANHFVYRRLIVQRMSDLVHTQVRGPTREERITAYRHLVAELKIRCDEIGSDFLVVFAYERGQVQGDDDSAYRTYADVGQDLIATGVASTDLYHDLRKSEFDGGPSLYYEEDIHWSTRGHQVVATSLSEHIESWKRVRLSRRNPVETAASHGEDALATPH